MRNDQFWSANLPVCQINGVLGAFIEVPLGVLVFGTIATDANHRTAGHGELLNLHRGALVFGAPVVCTKGRLIVSAANESAAGHVLLLMLYLVRVGDQTKSALPFMGLDKSMAFLGLLIDVGRCALVFGARDSQQYSKSRSCHRRQPYSRAQRAAKSAP